MRRIVLGLLGGMLAALVAARGLFPPAVPTWGTGTAWDSSRYNILDLSPPVTTETAGSALIAEMNSYYLNCEPTAKNEYTGHLAGQNLILILAENWQPAAIGPDVTPALYRLWAEGAKVTSAYAPEWYQGADGRAFSLLTGTIPTTVRGKTALVWTAEQDIHLPFALAACLGRAGYDCRAYLSSADKAPLYESLGFAAAEASGGSALDDISRTLPELAGSDPFFACYIWDDADGTAALTYLLTMVESTEGLAGNTAVCLWAGHQDALRGHLFLWGTDMAEATADGPCSELDVTPTLLNLLGAAYDSRFLSGRDIFASTGSVTDTGHAMALVSLYGTAYSDWVTDAGSYLAGKNTFFPLAGCFSGEREAAQYVQQVRRLVYDRYAFARRVMENNYFQVVFGL